ncbi:MAG: hypothetical protein ABEJ92_11930 [Halobacteriales archaeon]
MTREIRITIDDDEVFERMKRRKRELDLSWEEVLYRGLREADPGAELGDSASAAGWTFPGDRRSAGADPGGRAGDPYDDQWDRFADSVEAQVQRKVYDALRSTFGAAGIDVPEPPGGLDEEMADLTNAEDAVLVFDFLDDAAAYQVPLRVNLETSAEGLAVEVVAVRQGKSVREMNRFDPSARQTVTARLAEGAPASLRFDDGAEDYAVDPVLRWGRDDAGRPAVTDVTIRTVRLGGADGA